METLTLDRPLKTKEPRVLLDPALEPGAYQATVALNGDPTLTASVRILVTRSAGPESAEPALKPKRKPRKPSTRRKRSDGPA